MLSVIIPVFNRHRQVLLAVDSARIQRGLGARKLEIIVVDDNSTPPQSLDELSGCHLGDSPVKLVKLAKNSGPAAARNAGVLAASGELIAFLDSDDMWLTDKLACQLALLDQLTAAQPQALNAVTCGFYYREALTNKLHGRVPIPASSLSEFVGGCWFSPGSTLLVRKDNFLRVGLFDERLRNLEDLDWFVRFGRLGGHLHVVPHPKAIIFRQPNPRTLTNISEACDLISSKFGPDGPIAVGPIEWRSLKAYLSLERAVANLHNFKPLAAIGYAFQSIAAQFRFRATLRIYWTKLTNVPQKVEDTYKFMSRAASARSVSAAYPRSCDILVVVYSLSVGGTEKHLSLVFPALARRGYSIKIYNISGVVDRQISHVLATAGVQVMSPVSDDRRIAHAGIATLLRGVLGLVQTYFLEKPQLVHFFLPRAYLIGAPLAWIARRPKLVLSRRSLNAYQKSRPVLSFMERRLHHLMTAICGNSQSVLDQLHEDERVPPNRLFLIYNGVAKEPFERPLDKKSKRYQLGLSEDQLILICVANLIGYKGHSDLIAALNSIKSELAQTWTLLLVGRDDGIETHLKNQAKNLGISEQVHFLGQRSDVIELLRIADIGLLCSHQEGFSNALLEMMSAGLPCVATSVGGNPESVIDKETGLLVPANDPGAIAQAILRLASEPDLRRRMGVAGREHVRQHFTLETCVDGYEALYGAILGGLMPASGLLPRSYSEPNERIQISDVR